MKKILLSVAMLCMALCGRAETQDAYVGWPANYDGVMLQGFWWDSYDATKWSNLTARANELSQYFDLIWIPNSGTCSGDYNGSQGKSMGYDPCYWLHHNSCFGTEAELRTMIDTYKEKGVGFIADVVVNHKKGKTNWCDFPNESVDGTGQNAGITYNLEWDNSYFSGICKNDECNYYKDELGNYPYKTSGEYDTGDNFDGYRDLDHTNQHVRENIMIYLHFLLNELGFAGFRYDMVKGYSAGYIQQYNNNEYARGLYGTSAVPTFSVGEFWDNQENTQNWINGTGRTSAAFDFALKFTLNDAISRGNYAALQNKSFTYDPSYSRLSVTFADNHDTGRESSKLENNWSAANAFILASPGTPCVWFPHYEADPVNIRAMILARKACGITNTGYEILKQYPVENNGGYILETKGSKGSVYVQLGSAADDGTPDGYTLVAEGDAYKFYSTKADFASVNVSPNGGPFTTETKDVTLTAVNANEAWYKIDNGDPVSFSGEKTVQIGNGCNVNEEITISWGATGADNVEYTGSTTFTKRDAYNTPTVEENEVSVFFETNANEVTIWAWDDDEVNYTGGVWENKPAMNLMGVNEAGKLVHKWTYSGTGKPTHVLFVADDNQTSDFAFVNHGYYTESGISYHLGTNTVYFDNTVSNWEHVYYYAWDSNDHDKAAWPGEEITAVNGQYKVTLDGVYTNIIFNDGNGSILGVTKTKDLSVIDGATYAMGTNTVSFDNSQLGWDNVYYYAYTDNEIPKVEWPGESLSENTNGIYGVTLLEGYTKVIFHNNTTGIVGETKTANLDVVDGTVYTIGANTVYFDNSISQWNVVYYYAFTEDGTSKKDWPGEKFAANPEDKYEVTLSDIYTKIIFNNGTGGNVGVSQTEDLTIENGKEYALATHTVYYDNSQTNWENVYYYTFTDKGASKKAWPGETIAANANGKYEVTLLGGYSSIIFSDGNGGVKRVNQTEDLTVEDGKTYTLTANTVYFDNTGADWAQVYYYAFTDNKTPKAAWPGERINELNSAGYYEVTLMEGYTTIVFNKGVDGEGNQTGDLPVEDGKIYSLNAGANTQDGYTVYFNNTSNWPKVCAHIWNDQNQNLYGAWPGQELTTKTDDGYYMVHVDDASYCNIIFNIGNNGQQTADLAAVDGRVYTPAGMTDDLVLTEGYAYFNASEFTATTAKYTRVANNNWGTIILPFELTSDENVQYYELKSIGEETMTFEEVETVPAGQPAVFYLTETGSLTINAANVKVVPTADENKYGSDVSSWYMNGTYKTVNKASTSNNYIYYIANNAFWCSKYDESTQSYPSIEAKPFRAWIEHASSEPMFARFRIMDQEDPEGIELIQSETSDSSIYDLYGRQLSAPKKGFNVINGKLIIIK
jgi:alpha-amylase